MNREPVADHPITVWFANGDKKGYDHVEFKGSWAMCMRENVDPLMVPSRVQMPNPEFTDMDRNDIDVYPAHRIDKVSEHW